MLVPLLGTQYSSFFQPQCAPSLLAPKSQQQSHWVLPKWLQVWRAKEACRSQNGHHNLHTQCLIWKPISQVGCSPPPHIPTGMMKLRKAEQPAEAQPVSPLSWWTHHEFWNQLAPCCTTLQCVSVCCGLHQWKGLHFVSLFSTILKVILPMSSDFHDRLPGHSSLDTWKKCFWEMM